MDSNNTLNDLDMYEKKILKTLEEDEKKLKIRRPNLLWVEKQMGGV